MNNQSHKEKILSSAAVKFLNNISGAYSAPFWDGLLEVSGSLDTIRSLRSAIELLNDCGKNYEAYHLILALYDLAAIEIPTLISELESYPSCIPIFIDEFLLDIEDLMSDYEYEEQHNDET